MCAELIGVFSIMGIVGLALIYVVILEIIDRKRRNRILEQLDKEITEDERNK